MGATAMLAGTVLSAGSKMYGGVQQKNAQDQGAAMLQQEAGQTVASGIQQQDQELRKTAYTMSSARAHIAAGGLTTTGTSAQQTQAQILGQGKYNAATALWNAQDRAMGLNYQAAGMRAEGNAAEAAGWMGGISSVLTGGTSFYNKYAAA